MMLLPSLKSNAVIASAAWQSSSLKTQSNSGLLRRTLSVLLAITIGLLSFNPCQAAVEFDGIDDYFSVVSHTSLKPVDRLTIGYWFKRSPGQKNQLGAFQSASVANSDYILQVFSDNLIYMSVPNGGSNQYFVSTGTTIDTDWNSLYAVYDGTQTGNTNRLKVYLNGAIVTGTYFGTIPAVLNQGSLPIENRYNLNYTEGLMDDARIYNRALTENEIQTLYNSRSKRPSGSLVNGLIAHYEMDDDAIGEITAQAKDSSGNLNHGEFTGFNNLTTALNNDVPSQISTGHSLEFDGVNDHVRIGDNPILESSSRMTLSTWIKSSSAWPSSEGIIEKRINGTEYYQYGLSISSNNLYFLQSTSGTAWDTFVFTSTLPTAQSWHHLVGTNDGSVARLYIDGLEVGTPDLSPAATLAPSTSSLNLGLGRIAGLDNYLNGKIDDTRIYNRALTSSEISFLYNGSGLDPGTSNLQALWTFDGDSALKDSSGNNNHGVGFGGDSFKYTEGVLKR